MGVLKDMKFILNRLRPYSPFFFSFIRAFMLSLSLAGYLGNGNEVCMKNGLLQQIDGTAVESSCSTSLSIFFLILRIRSKKNPILRSTDVRVLMEQIVIYSIISIPNICRFSALKLKTHSN